MLVKDLVEKSNKVTFSFEDIWGKEYPDAYECWQKEILSLDFWCNWKNGKVYCQVVVEED